MRTRHFIRRSTVQAPAAALFRWHARPGAFERLNPGWAPVRVVHRSSAETPISTGVRVELSVPAGPVRTRWVVEHEGYVEGREFRDVQRVGPFTRWEHRHRAIPAGDRASVLEDDIVYELPLHPFGGLFGGRFADAQLQRLFLHRHAVTSGDLARHEQHAGHPPLRIAVTGATGFLGQQLVPFLTTGGHTVIRISRRAPEQGSGDVRWDPDRSFLDPAAIEGVDAVIHLAGENLDQRWSDDARRRILESRTRGTSLIARTLARLERRPKVLVSMSAVGVYGDTGDREVDESSPPGTGFLSEVVQAWEAAADPARAAGIRVVHPRTGVVLAAGGGALDRLLLPFRLGLGGRIGSGRQWFSWISREDAIGALHHLLFADLAGPVNVVAPQQVRNEEFTRTLAAVLHRPRLGFVPAFGLRAVFGQMAEETILEGQRVRADRLLASGFRFLYPSLEAALRFELGRQER